MADSSGKTKSMRTEGVDDMILLTKIEVSEIAENLKKRLAKDIIYTYIGEVLIAVNPFKYLNYFTDRELELYQNSAIYENPPHIYYICDSSFRGLLNDGENQCVIISGESGAGKTVSAKYVMSYITKVSGGGKDVDYVKEVILKSNPLLEAFGNAKTLRNDNSSRFGKYVEIQFKTGGVPSGGRISNFLLEKSRVVLQSKGERSFHIFYQLLEGLSDSEKHELNLTKPEDYNYLYKSECFHIPGTSDAEEFNEVRESFSVVGISTQLRDTIIRLMAGILHAGNIEFVEEGNIACIQDETPLKMTAKLFEVDHTELLSVITTRNMESKWGAKSETIKLTHNCEQAYFARDAIVKAIYFRNFGFLVDTINTAIEKSDCDRSIGILDIYGFEIFDSNGFEQFCINFVNEKLQQIFIELTLKVEQEDYLAENIGWKPITYFNNKTVCDLIESTKNPLGIISIMDDVCATMHAKGEGADAKLVDDLGKLISHNHFFISGQGFTISHYAGKVTYDIPGFCEKNRDVLFNDPIELLKRSKCKYLADLFPEDTTAEKKGRPTTAGSKIRGQAQILVTKLMECRPHYIRCIKPNETKKPYDFDMPRVKHQIEYQGLKENIRIIRAGFAYKRPFAKFLDRFGVLTDQTFPNWRGDVKDGVEHILNTLEVDKTEWKMGVTKIFLKHPENLFFLEELRDRKYEGYSRVIQKYWRKTSNQSAYDKEKREASDLVFNKKERFFGTLNRKFVGNYYNFDSESRSLTFIEKKETIMFSVPVTLYNNKLKSAVSDLFVTQKHIYLIGRELVKKGPHKGKLNEVLTTKIPIKEIRNVSLSPYQDDFVVIQDHEGFCRVMETPLKTEFIYNLNKIFKKLAGSSLPLSFQNQIEVLVKKEGLFSKTNLKVIVQTDNNLGNNAPVTKCSSGKLLVTVKPGLPSSSKPTQSSKSRASGYKPDLSIETTAPKINTHTDNAPKINAPKTNGGAKIAVSQNNKQRPPPIPSPQPPPIPRRTTDKVAKCKALYEYSSDNPDELSFSEGTIIEIIKEDPSGWWKGRIGASTGVFPSNYVEKVE